MGNHTDWNYPDELSWPAAGGTRVRCEAGGKAESVSGSSSPINRAALDWNSARNCSQHLTKRSRSSGNQEKHGRTMLVHASVRRQAFSGLARGLSTHVST